MNRPEQEQFLDVIDRDEAERRFRDALDLRPLGCETVALDEALGRVLSVEVRAEVDVPSFDRSNYDGFAVQAADTFGARDEVPRRLRLLEGHVAAGSAPIGSVSAGTAMAIATGGMVPRGADAIVMVEHADAAAGALIVRKAVTPGFGIAFAGTDVAAGETVLRPGDLLSSRETGVLAAIGVDRVEVWRRVRVAIVSTGDELIPPGSPMRPGLVYDSNEQVLADAVRELGAQPHRMGVVSDDAEALRRAIDGALADCDVVVMSGGTSKGQGDLSYRIVAELTQPGIVAHGVALKPGKPICLAVHRGQPVVILPGFPTSAIFTFHEFVAPVIRLLGGRPAESRQTVPATMAVQVNSEIGRTEYLLVGLVEVDDGLAAYPMGKGSGSVTTFSRADGFVTIGRHREIVEAGAAVEVQRLARDLRLADLVVIGSHCTGLDRLLSRLQLLGFATKFLAVGSTAGLEAAQRGQCDVAGIHLLDPVSGQYNEPFLAESLALIRGYRRRQGLIFRRGDDRFVGRSVEEAIARAIADPECHMVNRNQGSGTRILIDDLLQEARPPGYAVQARSHNAVAAAVVQQRADWGLAIASVAASEALGFLPYRPEQFDFIVPLARRDRPAVVALERLLADPDMRDELRSLGFSFGEDEPPA